MGLGTSLGDRVLALSSETFLSRLSRLGLVQLLPGPESNLITDLTASWTFWFVTFTEFVVEKEFLRLSCF